MRRALVLLAAALAFAPSARADETLVRPAHPRVVAAASYVAGGPVGVYCGRNDSMWRDLLASRPPLRTDALGFTPRGGTTTYLSPLMCSYLNAKLAGKPVGQTFRFGQALLTLVHESVHLQGVTDESEADCAALDELPNVARRYFGFRKARTIRALMVNAWDAHRFQPAGYRRLC